MSEDINRDELLIPTFDEGISVFGTAENGEIRTIHSCVSVLIVCRWGSAFCYAGGTDRGELLFFEYENYSEIARYAIANKRITNLCYHKSDCVLVVFMTEVCRFDIPTLTVIERFVIDSHEISALHGDMFFVGAKSGFIQTFLVGINQVLNVSDRSVDFHKAVITGLTFSRTFFVSASRDKYVRFWDYRLNPIGEVWLPFPVLTCELLNGKRHLLVATDEAILIINGPLMFDDQVDLYDAQIDSFDIKKDEKALKAEADPEEDDFVPRRITEAEPEIPVKIPEVPKLVLPEPPAKILRAESIASRNQVTEVQRRKILDEMMEITNSAAEADERQALQALLIQRESAPDKVYLTTPRTFADFASSGTGKRGVPPLAIPNAPAAGHGKKKRPSRRSSQAKLSARRKVPQPLEPPKPPQETPRANPRRSQIPKAPTVIAQSPRTRGYGDDQSDQRPVVVAHTFSFNADSIFAGIAEAGSQSPRGDSQSPRYAAYSARPVKVSTSDRAEKGRSKP
jgi:hypothetical protein